MSAYTLIEPENLKELAANISLPFAKNLVSEWVGRLTTDNNLLFIDFESYYDDDLTLQKLTNYDYVAHKFFKLHSVSYVRGHDHDVKLVWGHDEALAAIAGEIKANPNTVIVAQNTMFDGTVLTFNEIIPRHFLDILGMSRAWFKQQMYHNLNAILERLFPDDPTMRKAEGLSDTKGIRVLNEMLQGVLGPYNIRDVELLRSAFYEFMRLGFPVAELPILDLTLQMSCVPRFVADVPLLEKTRDDAQKNQQEKVAAALEYMKTNGNEKFNPIFFCAANDRNKVVWKTKKAYNEDYREEFGMGPIDKPEEAIKFLSSNQKFEYILTHKFGIKVPMKESPTAKKRGDYELIPALGINDVEFQQLMAEYRELRVIWEGRIASKSNIEYTRAVTLLRLAEIFDGHIILPIKYSAAHTDRFGGGDGVNPQNFTRGGNHRKSLKAQEGMAVHVRDSSNIELRMSAAFCEHYEKIDLFRKGGDPYITMADKIFGYMCNKKDHPTERGVGKATELGCFAKGTAVVTDAGIMPIEQIRTCNKVWNGVEWVSHKGPVYKGVKDVINIGNSGIYATPEHLIWVDEYPKQAFTATEREVQVAAQRERTEFRHIDSDFQRMYPEKWEQIVANAVFWMQGAEMEAELPVGLMPELSSFREELGRRTKILGRALRLNEAAMQQSIGHELPELRRTWNSIELQIEEALHRIRDGDLRETTTKDASGQDTKRWTLRAGKLTACIERGKQSEQTHEYVYVLQWDAGAEEACVPCSTDAVSRDTLGRENDTTTGDERQEESSRNTRVLLWPSDLHKKQTYDITDCEKGNRFALSNGLVVKNCGYGMGRDRFRDYLNAGPLGMPPTFLEDIPALAGEVNPYLTVVNAYREQNWPITAMWRQLETVLMDMTYKGTDTTLGPLKIGFETMTGPNGLKLQYPQLGYRNKQWSYLSADGWTNLFGGKVLENIIQFLSRIGICEQMVLVAAMAEYLGGRCVLQVHDEIVTLIWNSVIDKFDDFVNEVMHQPLSWMPLCPLASEADIGPTYS